MEGTNNELLNKILEISQDNHYLLKKVRAHQKNTMYAKIAYWVFLIIIFLGGYYYLRPVLEKLRLSKASSFIQNIPDLKSIKNSVQNLEQDYNDIKNKLPNQ